MMKNIAETIQYILADVSSKCVLNGISFHLHNTANVVYDGDGTECSGFFNGAEDDKSLEVAFNKPTRDWLPVLLHESCHMDQYLENAKVWQDITMPDGSESTDMLFQWAAGNAAEKRVIESMLDLDDIINRALQVELDCERRTLEKIISYDLIDFINPIEYIQKSNSYIYFYLFIKEYGAFYDAKNKPYENHMIWSAAPSHFNGDYTKIPPLLLEAFRKHL